MKKKAISKLFSLAIAAAMVFGSIPATNIAKAEENEIQTELDTSTEMEGQSLVSLEGTDVYNGLRGQSFNEGWMFQEGEVENGQDPDFDDSSWRSLALPHDYSIEHSFDPSSPAGGDEAI